MTYHPTLPFEIIEMIIDAVAQHDPTFSSLKTCSLACQIFLELCRKHIFASITIHDRNRGPNPTSAALVRLLSTTPGIADHIRKLRWLVELEQLPHNAPLPGILEKIMKLESLTINWALPLDIQWSDNRLRSAILHLLHLPTLIRLEMHDVQDFAFADLIPCTNLHELRLHAMKSVETESTSVSILPPKPVQVDTLFFGVRCSTAISMMGASLRPDGRPVFNLAVLASIQLQLDTFEDFEASRKLFQHCSRLSKVAILLDSPPLTWTGIAKMLKPSIGTLTHLHLKTATEDETGANDPLGGLVPELEEMRHQNVVEKVTIDVFVSSYYECSHGDDWGLLDIVMTQSGWPKLKGFTALLTTTAAIAVGCASSDVNAHSTLRSLIATINTPSNLRGSLTLILGVGISAQRCWNFLHSYHDPASEHPIRQGGSWSTFIASSAPVQDRERLVAVANAVGHHCQ
ncbi:hypothetical protein M413DRAFT_32243 [Hebeloma cylindrosporum]|uniref:F-box domain-containing protein n=1 Tax=Hebeloma cylindrosporum TaxID=76867 RepID=A0A0C3BUN5_HEBCY|nr:hypothetical protein M413DRAFT_32243 [Hebeloma cylindrosporum h7]